ncbi:basal body-orientation factor 1 [Myxocyprinus asiaticus]|uniref:basal body-orientation factor 1 n=1 Tax=Myxocyprinus asiaticus TaxID=70543 RepID=UPI00222381F5|nr:basal body-orientation factor 1 [Myxocyprinus asiaticus]
MMTTRDKECELPAADSYAIMEGEDAEDDLIYLSKKSFFTKTKSYSREKTGPSALPATSSDEIQVSSDTGFTEKHSLTFITQMPVVNMTSDSCVLPTIKSI